MLPALAGEERKRVMDEILAAGPGGAALAEVADRLRPEELAGLAGSAGSSVECGRSDSV